MRIQNDVFCVGIKISVHGPIRMYWNANFIPTQNVSFKCAPAVCALADCQPLNSKKTGTVNTFCHLRDWSQSLPPGPRVLRPDTRELHLSFEETEFFVTWRDWGEFAVLASNFGPDVFWVQRCQLTKNTVRTLLGRENVVNCLRRGALQCLLFHTVIGGISIILLNNIHWNKTYTIKKSRHDGKWCATIRESKKDTLRIMLNVVLDIDVQYNGISVFKGSVDVCPSHR